MKKAQHLRNILVAAAITLSLLSVTCLNKQTTGAAIGGGGIVSVTNGAVNCNAGTTCVKKIGDIAHLSYTIQSSKLLSSEGTNIQKTVIFVPKVLQNVKLTLVSVPDREKYEQILQNSPANVSMTAAPEVPVQAVNKELNIVELKIDAAGNFVDAAGKIVYAQGDKANPPAYGGQLSSNLQNPNLGVFKSSSYVNTEEGQASYLYYSDISNNMTNHELYDEYSFTINEDGVFTLKLEGDVKTESELTVLPIRVTNAVSIDHSEGGYNNSQMLTDYSEAVRGALPKYSLSDATINRALLAQNTKDGLTGCAQCAVTKEINSKTLIGADVDAKQKPYAKSFFDWYIETFQLKKNPAMSYKLNGVDEDACDQAAAVITLCPDAEPNPGPNPGPNPEPNPTPTPTPNPVPTPKQTETSPAPTVTTTVTEPTPKHRVVKTGELRQAPSIISGLIILLAGIAARRKK